MLKMSAVDVFNFAINSPATDYEYTRKLKRYEKFFNIVDWDSYIKQDGNTIHDEED